MTRAELFIQVASEGLSGGFAIGQRLPEEVGTLDGIEVVNYLAGSDVSYVLFEKWLIEYFKEKPERQRELRSRQLGRLLKEIYQNKQYLVFVIDNAHFLPKRDIKLLKRLHEISDGPYPGIVLLGDVANIKKKLDSLPDIKLRYFTFV